MAQPTYQNLFDENRRLREENRQLREENRQLRIRVDTLEAQVLKLTTLLEQAQRTGKRQAAPFSKGTPKQDPKAPGRKPGDPYGPKAHRPLPEQKPDEIIDVPLPEQCPDCGGLTEEDHVDQQFQVEIPRRPIVRRFDIHVGRCCRCGRRLQPRHPLQTSNAIGAAASQLGPDLQALMALMKDKYGLSYGDIQGLLDEAFGISVSRGGAAQVVLRVAERHEPAYEAIQQIVRRSDIVYPDETGWKIGGWLQWLWVFVTPTATLCVIRPSRGHDVPEEILGADYDGRMIHDGWSPYDFFKKATHQQCLEHLLRRAEALLERAARGAVRFPRKVTEFLTDALALRDRRDSGVISPHGLAVARGRLEKRLDHLLEWNLSHRGNQKFQKHLAGHSDEILTFLYDADIEATKLARRTGRSSSGGQPQGLRRQSDSLWWTCPGDSWQCLCHLDETGIGQPVISLQHHLFTSRPTSSPHPSTPPRPGQLSRQHAIQIQKKKTGHRRQETEVKVSGYQGTR